MNRTSSTEASRWQEIVDIWKKEQWLYGVAGVMLGFVLGLAVAGVLENMLTGFADGFWDEVLSIAFIVFALDRLNYLRAQKAHKIIRFRQLKSRSNENAVDALTEIQEEGWWEEALEYYRNTEGIIDLRSVLWSGGINLSNVNLQHSDMWNANLQRANLREANLQHIYLGSANLQSCNLTHANLREADLRDIDLKGSQLSRINLQNAKLNWSDLRGCLVIGANLQEVDLEASNIKKAVLKDSNLQYAKLHGINLEQAILINTDMKFANLQSSNLQEADLRDANLAATNLWKTNLAGVKNVETAQFDQRTILPDANRIIDENDNVIFDKYWTPDTDMMRYIDAKHPDFWEPDYITRGNWSAWMLWDKFKGDQV